MSRKKINKIFLKKKSIAKYLDKATHIVKEYVDFFSEYYSNHLIEHYDNIKEGPQIMRIISKHQWSEVKQTHNINFFLNLNDKEIISQFPGANLSYIANYCEIPIETIRRKLNIFQKKGWLLKKNKKYFVSSLWIHKHIPVAFYEIDKIINTAERIKKYIK